MGKGKARIILALAVNLRQISSLLNKSRTGRGIHRIVWARCALEMATLS